jgi:hypothetical protein
MWDLTNQAVLLWQVEVYTDRASNVSRTQTWKKSMVLDLRLCGQGNVFPNAGRLKNKPDSYVTVVSLGDYCPLLSTSDLCSTTLCNTRWVFTSGTLVWKQL